MYNTALYTYVHIRTRTGSRCTHCSSWPSIRGMILRKTKVLEKLVPVPLCPTHLPNGMTWFFCFVLSLCTLYCFVLTVLAFPVVLIVQYTQHKHPCRRRNFSRFFFFLSSFPSVPCYPLCTFISLAFTSLIPVRHKTLISMPPAGFQPAIPASDQPLGHWDRQDLNPGLCGVSSATNRLNHDSARKPKVKATSSSSASGPRSIA